jgi:hypothetical protein
MPKLLVVPSVFLRGVDHEKVLLEDGFYHQAMGDVFFHTWDHLKNIWNHMDIIIWFQVFLATWLEKRRCFTTNQRDFTSHWFMATTVRDQIHSDTS